jgi:hypothetical protein
VQGQPVQKLLAADVLEKNQQLSSACSSNVGRHQRRQRGALRQSFGKVRTMQESLGIDYLPGTSSNQRR